MENKKWKDENAQERRRLSYLVVRIMTEATLRKIGLVAGPALFALIVAFFPIADVSFEQRLVLGITAWMASWWISEALPIYVTALLPAVLFPLFGIMNLGEISTRYADRIVFLFLGGLLIAKAVEKTGLHKRFALNIFKVFGTNPKYIVAAFVMVTGFLSAWMSNTATAMLMVPIAAAVIAQIADEKQRTKFGACLMLAVAYSASLGGMATLIGTPPNAIFASLSKSLFDIDTTFVRWMVVGMPISAVSLFVVWLYLVNFGPTKIDRTMKSIAGEKSLIASKLAELGRMNRDEKVVGAVFLATAVTWVTRGLLWKDFLPMVDDAMIAVSTAMFLFAIPSVFAKAKKAREGEYGNSTIIPKSKNKEKSVDAPKIPSSPEKKDYVHYSSRTVLDWKSAATIPWGVLILIGGGLAIASGFSETGLDKKMAEGLGFLGNMHFVIIILVVVTVTIVAGEFISNTATAALMIPVVASLASSISVDPLLLMASVAVATSYGFIMPVGTPPNAIAFASGHVTARKMAKSGLPLDIIGIIVATVMTSVLIPLAWGR